MSALERSLVWLAWLALLLASPALVHAEPRQLSVEDAVRLAQERNPELREIAWDVNAAQARVRGASAINYNPVFTGTAGPRSSVAGDSIDFGVQLTQQVEIGGQRSARMDAADSAVTATEAKLRALRANLTARVRQQFARALAMGQRLALADEVLAIAAAVKAASEERFSAGAAPKLEINTARVEVGRATRERAQAERALVEALSELRGLLGLDPAEEIATSGELARSDAEIREDSAKLVEQALAARPELQERRFALESARAEARLAEREVVPSPRLGVSYNYERESKASIVQGILSVELPVFQRNLGARGASAARARQRETALDNSVRQIKLEVVTALARMQAARAAAQGYAGDVVQAMQDNMELATDSYRAGKIDFLQLIVIRRQAVEARREYIDVLEELAAARVALDWALARGAPSAHGD